MLEYHSHKSEEE